jgi:hypothetical protein
MIDVFLAGEGPNELGGWCKEHEYRDEHPTPGVLETLAKQVAPSGWQVRDAIQWKNISKLAVGTKGKGAERKAILAAHLHAKERGCSVLLFSRDRDGPKNVARQHEIEAAVAELEGSVAVAGGVCIERLESWLLALSGHTGTEELRDRRTDTELESLGVASKDTVSMAAYVQRHEIAAVPSDATSLNAWLIRVQVCLGQADEPTNRPALVEGPSP